MWSGRRRSTSCRTIRGVRTMSAMCWTRRSMRQSCWQRVEHDALTLCRALGYDLNTVEFAVEDGVPYAIDFMNPAPDADVHSVGEKNFRLDRRQGSEPRGREGAQIAGTPPGELRLVVLPLGQASRQSRCRNKAARRRRCREEAPRRKRAAKKAAKKCSKKTRPHKVSRHLEARTMRPTFSLGIEEEYQTIDPETRDLRSHIKTEMLAQGQAAARRARQGRDASVRDRGGHARLPQHRRRRARTSTICAAT